ncbi:hypothetical protein GCM10007079_06770 [Nocardiopsis terrae]|uniref:Alkaline shock response membrane anchor protein AmaP n=1 Tax=Nocardiopsis terrae TaxID=372655 RepID=A0ABR9HP09_9ACTN|nr:hypothetical protein [Nocardiopsis terrae]MBE1460724.1 hypothetical protein [Nocardiopsis terrae]GHC73118.1 hypothetical protein GCM10007079_06770 [Nocardiopsis terrae]
MRRYPHRAARRTARGNRQGLALVGVLLLAAGSAVPLLVHGPFHLLASGSPGQAPRTAGERIAPLLAAPWVPYAAAVLSVGVVLLALRWLLVQGRSARVPELRLDEGDRGRTDVLARAACKALTREVVKYPGVYRGRAQLTESPREPCLLVDLVLTEDADPVAVWQRCRDDALARLRLSLDLDRLPTVLRISVSGQPSGRRLA